MAEPGASLELGSEVIETLRSTLEAMYPLRSFDIADFRELANAHDLTYEESLLDFLYFLLNVPRLNVQNGCEDVNSHYNDLALKGTADSVDLFNRLMSPEAHGNLFRSWSHFRQYNKFLSIAMLEEDSDRYDG